MSKNKKIIIGVCCSIFIVLCLVFGSDNGKINNESKNEANNEMKSEIVESKNPYSSQEKTIRKFVDEYNQTAQYRINDVEYKNNHKIAYLKTDISSIKVNDNEELGFITELEFRGNGNEELIENQKIINCIIKTFDSTITDEIITSKVEEAKNNNNVNVKINDNVSINYNYISKQVGYIEGNTYIISLTGTNYNK